MVYELLNSRILRTQKEKDEDNCKYTFRLPFVGNPSLVLKRKLTRLFQKHGVKINVVFSSFKVKNYFSLKDKSGTQLRASLIYRFGCLDDPSNSYIGKTKRYLNKRIIEHQKPGSAIFGHLEKCSSCQNSEIEKSFTVLDKGNNDFELQILEALHIINQRPTLNKQLAGDGCSFRLNVF